MKNYYDEFVKLAMQLCCKDDYEDMQKVRKNNRAMNKLLLLRREMQKNECQDILFKLLRHEHERVRMSAAAACLEMNVYAIEATEVLRNIMQLSGDVTYRFNAKMLLQKYNL